MFQEEQMQKWEKEAEAIQARTLCYAEEIRNTIIRLTSSLGIKSLKKEEADLTASQPDSRRKKKSVS